MEQEKRTLEENWQQVKNLLVEKEKELASVEDKHSERTMKYHELENQLRVFQTEKETLLSERVQLESQIDNKDIALKELTGFVERLQIQIEELRV